MNISELWRLYEADKWSCKKKESTTQIYAQLRGERRRELYKRFFSAYWRRVPISKSVK